MTPGTLPVISGLPASEFRIERQLGSGSTSVVYLARELALDRSVTIKVLRHDATADPAARARFEREARATANIVHPSVATLYRFGVLPDGSPFLVSRYVKGRTLEQLVVAEGPLDPARARRVLSDIASALEAAHRVGVVHRDIRPDNIILDETDGRAILTDFGIATMTEVWPHGEQARLTGTGQVLGDPRYTSPEQLRGEPVTEASDVYSLALVAFEILTGVPPHAAAGARAAAVARLRAEPVAVPAEITRADPLLADILRRCSAADPAQRPSAHRVSTWLAANVIEPHERNAWQRIAHALARGKVFHWMAATAAFGWLLLQAVDQLVQNRMLHPASYPVVLASVVAAIVGAAILAWFHGERGEQHFRSIEIVLLGLLTITWIASVVAILT